MRNNAIILYLLGCLAIVTGLFFQSRNSEISTQKPKPSFEISNKIKKSEKAIAEKSEMTENEADALKSKLKTIESLKLKELEKSEILTALKSQENELKKSGADEKALNNVRLNIKHFEETAKGSLIHAELP